MIAVGGNIMLMMAVITYLQTAQVVYAGCLRGAGDTRYTAMVSLISISFIRPVLSYALAYPLGLGLYGAWFGIIVDQTIRYVLCHDRFIKAKWMQIKL